MAKLQTLRRDEYGDDDQCVSVLCGMYFFYYYSCISAL